jgi:archaeal type IV pilus assembly protein PilA
MKSRLFKIIKIRSNKKGISPVVATLLLIAIAVAAAIVSYAWIMSMIKTQGSAAQTGIRLEVVKFTNATINGKELVNVTIRNVGSVGTKIQTMYVTYSDTTYSQDYTVNNTIAVGKTREISFGSDELPSGFSWDYSEAYDIKIVTDNGFTVEGTFYAPNS